MEAFYDEIMRILDEMMDTTTAVMAPYPTNVIGRPNPFNKKEKKGKEKAAVFKFKYKKNGKIRKTPKVDIVEGKQEGESTSDYHKRISAQGLEQVKAELANVKANRRNQEKVLRQKRDEIKKLDPNWTGYPIRNMVLRQDAYKAADSADNAIIKTKELAKKRDSLERKISMNAFESLENLRVSEECLNEIVDMVEELILERNKENREAKKKWEMNRGNYHENPADVGFDTKEKALERGERTIKDFKKYVNKSKDSRSHIVNQEVVDDLSKGNRIILGRHQNPVSFGDSKEYNKVKSPERRAEQSKRGSTKDEYPYNKDPLMVTNSILKRKIEDKQK